MSFTREQMDAVRRLGQNVCVTGGPGSGKTRVLGERFLWRVEQGLSPSRILTITFTEKAANELRQRLARDFAGRPELNRELECACISTVHGFCARLLREHAIAAGLDPRFEVLDAAEASAELRAAAEQALNGLLAEQPVAARRLLDAVDFTDAPAALAEAFQSMRLTFLGGPQNGSAARFPEFSAALRSLITALERIVEAAPADWDGAQKGALDRLKDWRRRLLSVSGRPPGPYHFEALAAFDSDLNALKKDSRSYEEGSRVKQTLLPAARQALAAAYYAPQRALLWEAVVRLAGSYRERKQARNALDFADLQELAIVLLRDHPEIRGRVREGFDEVLMDELQDSNPLEQTLIDLVSRPGRFFAAGDLNQSICGARYADPDVFKRYREAIRRQGQKVDRLPGNHRSRPDILAAVEAILVGAPGIEPHQLEPARRFAEKAEPSVEVIVARAATGEQAAALEARLVARRMRELAGALRVQANGSAETRGARFGDIALLVRDTQCLPPFEQAFRELDIPFALARGARLFDAQEVADLLRWLRILENPRDEISMAAVMRSPLLAIRDETLLRLKQLGNLSTAVEALREKAPAGFDAGERERLVRFREFLGELRAQRDDLAPDRLVTRVLDETGYEAGLDAPARANVRELLALLRTRFARNPRPLGAVLEELERLRTFGEEPGSPPCGGSDAVRVMTIHSAKGREFPIVFLPALDRRVQPRRPPLAFSPRAGLVARWLDPATGAPLEDLSYAAFAEDLERQEREEADRLFYVAMTRAEEHLVFSFATAEGGPRDWAAAVVSGLGLPDRGEAFVHPCSRGRRPFPVRVLPAAETPAEAAAPPVLEAVERVPCPTATEQHDETASVSSVWLFAHCPRRYYLSRYVGWNAQPGVVVAAHGPADAADDTANLEATELDRQVHALLAGQEVKNAERSAKELASRFEASELGRRAACAERCETEFDFLMEVEGIVLQGRIDLWFLERGELVLVDYKADEVALADAAEHARSYALQLRLYALALERFAGRMPDRACVYLLGPDLPVEISLGPQDIHAARQAVRALRDAQSDLDFPLSLGSHCRRCPYFRGLCPA